MVWLEPFVVVSRVFTRHLGNCHQEEAHSHRVFPRAIQRIENQGLYHINCRVASPGKSLYRG